MSGAQMRKLAKPMIKKVGTIFCGMISPPQIRVRAEPAQSSIMVQNNLSAIFSVMLIQTTLWDDKLLEPFKKRKAYFLNLEISA